MARRARHRDLNYDLNLVPFVDLLSVCICFLLMTAVWLQVGSLQVKQSHGEAAAKEAPKLEIQVAFKDNDDVQLAILEHGRTIFSRRVTGNDHPDFYKKMTEVLDAGLAQGAVVDAAMITPSPKAPYGSLIVVMDVLRKRQIVNLAVVPTAG